MKFCVVVAMISVQDCTGSYCRKRQRDEAQRLLYGDVMSREEAGARAGVLVHKRQRLPDDDKTWHTSALWKLWFNPNLRVRGHRRWREFKRRYRLTPLQFDTLLDELKPHLPERQVGTGGRRQVPVWAKVLNTLDVLGRGQYFDDVASRAEMGEETVRMHVRQVLVAICKLRSKYIPPLTDDMFAELEAPYKLRGLPGCVGSIDCVQVGREV